MFYIAAIFCSLIGLYAISSFFLYSLPIVEAGPIAGVKHTGIQRMSKQINASYIKSIDGTSYNYRRFVVQGTCMRNIGIEPKSVVSIRMFNNETEKGDLEPGKAVLIFINDSTFRGYKIRVIKRLMADGTAETYYFNEDKSEHPSSKPHNLVNIIGTVDLKESGIAA